MSRVRGFHAEIIKERFKGIFENKKEYEFFDGGRPYNVNIIGIRNPARQTNKFDDTLLLVYRDSYKRWLVDSYQITTDPGLYWMKNPMNVHGTAILCPGQYRGVYRIDKHRGKYDALCQRGAPVSVWRDGDRDSYHDMNDDTIETGYFGINIHKAGRSSTQVDKWSAGCQVFKNNGDYKEFMETIRDGEKAFGNSFTYTLLDSIDLELEQR